MGKHSRRQRAKLRKRTRVQEEPNALCCLPHCEEPGEKLICGHALCGFDLLKVARYADFLQEFIISCPICRNESFIEDKLMQTMVDKQPFKCATFKCYCNEPNCSTLAVGFLLPCRSHKSHTCQVCPGSTLTVATTSEKEPEEEEEPFPFRQQGWGISDRVFEEFLRQFKALRGGMTDVNELVYREARRSGGVPGELWDYLSRHPVADSMLQKFQNCMMSAISSFVHESPVI